METGEVCDDGKHCTDGTTTCTTDVECIGIGDGSCATRDGTGCSATCASDETCGNGTIDPGEACDDGNTSGGDSCNASCTSAATCGNGALNGSEACDDGKHCTDGTTSCNNTGDCSGIGDGSCETRSGDGCNATCSSDESCGNSIIDPGETCDDGNGSSGDGCSSLCAPEFCGNNVTDPGEACDNGNTTGGDGCSANCSSDETCGNGIVDPGESCDDGMHCTDGTSCTEAADCAGIGDGTCDERDGDGCGSTCVSEFCGNGATDGGEACDDGKHCTDGTTSCTDDGDCTGIGDGTCAPRSGTGCDSICASDETCGNGVLDPGEDCDDDNNVSGDGCSATCVGEYCGNGVSDPSEACDDGMHCTDGTTSCTSAGDCTGIGDGSCATRDGTGCSATCASDETCGNDVVDPGEDCDDGGTTADDGCSATCTAEFCGNNTTDGVETCDDGNTTDSGNGCSAICQRNDVCGDGTTQGLFETCDDNNNLACGTCNATCDTAVVAAAATGSFTTVADVASSLDDTVVTLDDGINPAITFELDDGASPDCTGTATNICVTFTADDSAQTISDLMVAAIDGVAALLIDADNTGGASTTVDLTHDRNTNLGNQTVAIGSTGFAKTDMSGGVAGDCTAGQGCNSPNDCVSNSCTANVCD